jgi:hypothetical protein
MEESHLLALRGHHKPVLAVSTQEIGIHSFPGKLYVSTEEV